MHRRYLLLVTLCAVSLGALAVDISDDGLHVDWLDRSVDPGQDFYSFANGGWLKANPIPDGSAGWGVLSVMKKHNQDVMHMILEDNAKTQHPEGSTEQKVGDFYATGMDEAAIESAGVTALQSEFDAIAAIKDQGSLWKEIAHLQMLGVDDGLGFHQMQDFKDSSQVIGVAWDGGTGLPDRDYYLSTADQCAAPAGATGNAAQAALNGCKTQADMYAKVREAYVAHIAAMLQLLGDPADKAASEARSIMTLETRLAQAQIRRIDTRDPKNNYHPMSVEDIEVITPHLDWRALLADVGHPEIKAFNLGHPDFFKALDREVAGGTSLDDWKAYLRWRTIDFAAPYLSKAFVDEDFKMKSAMSGAKEPLPRWQSVLSAEDTILGFAMGKLFVEKQFPPSSKRAVLDILHGVRGAFDDDLKDLPWMSPESRKQARIKLSQMGEHIGYPDKWPDYSGLEVRRDSYVQNVMRGNQFLRMQELNKIGKPADKDVWIMTPQTVSAFYYPPTNTIDFAAGVLQPPYFDPNAPAAVNYGAIGFVMGHEITHGYDDQGSQFDGRGNLKNWLTPDDATKFHKAYDCLTEQYSEYTVANGVHLQGRMVTAEVTAHLGGLTLAYRAFHASKAYKEAKTIDGFTPDQQFFLGAAHALASQLRPEAEIRYLTLSPNPPSIYAVNGTLANMPAFQQAFGIKDGSPMVKKDRCVIW